MTSSCRVPFEGQDVVATLIDDLPGDVTLTIEGVDGHDRSLERQHFQQPGHGGNFIGFGVGGNLRQDQALLTAPSGHHVQRRLAAGRIEGAAQDLAVNRDDALCGFGTAHPEALKAAAELVGIEQTQNPAERVMTWHTVLQFQETAEELLLGLGKLGHIHGALPATQYGAKRNHQQFQQIVAPGIARARIVQPFKASAEPFHPSFSTHRIQQLVGRVDDAQTRKSIYLRQAISNAIPMHRWPQALDATQGETARLRDAPKAISVKVVARRGVSRALRKGIRREMHASIARHRDALIALCRRYDVERLEVFGSAARGDDFDPARSDADFLVTFKPESRLPPLEQFLGFAEALEDLLGRPVDLVEPQGVKNPYILAGINRSREVVYAA